MSAFHFTITARLIILSVIASLVFAAPVHFSGVLRAEAVAVQVTSDSSSTNVGTLIESAISSAENIAQTYFASADNFKEYVLDPLMWMLANTMISNMLRSLTQWVNSGFEGNPAFVTDVEGFLIDAVDDAVGEFINSSELGFLCDAFSLDVRTALAIQYQASKSFGAQCSLSDISNNVENFLDGSFSDGGWPAWFELTQSPYNDPNRAFLEGRTELYDLVARTSNREFEELQANEFFLNVESCEMIDTPGGRREVCKTGTPGNIVQDQVSDSLGIGRDRLTFADEFDELVGALLSQFANQAIMGANGILGMGGGSGTSYSYGSSGNLSYLGALDEETFGGSISESTDPIGDAIVQQQQYIGALQNIIAAVDRAEEDIDDSQQQYGSCFNVRMPSRLTRMRADAYSDIFTAQQRINLFSVYEQQYDAAETPDERLDVMLDFNGVYANIYAQTIEDKRRAELDLSYTIPPIVSDLRSEIRDEEDSCERNSGGGSNNDDNEGGQAGE